MTFKWSLSQLREEYKKMGISYEEVFKNIKAVCIKTLMAVEPQITTAMRASKTRGNCFEIYGFDVLIDAKLRPWLLEVNVAPSLSSSSPYDKQVKTLLLCDTIHLVGFNVYDRKKIEDEKKKENKHRLLGFEPSKGTSKRAERQASAADDEGQVHGFKQLGVSPSKVRELGSPDRIIERKVGLGRVGNKDKFVIPSFLDGFNVLTEDDLDILAQYEEE